MILFLAGLASLFLLGGCSFGATLEEIREENGLDAQVTYYSNGGTFSGTPEKKELYYKSGTLALDIGNEKVGIISGGITLSRVNYEFDGWYYAVLDEEGNPVFLDEGKTQYKLGDPVDFSVPLGANEHRQVVAKWLAKVKVNIQLVCSFEEGETLVNGKDGTVYKEGDVIASYNYDTSDRVGDPKSKAPIEVKDKTHTFVEYYADQACTQYVSWPLVKGEEQETDATIYAKYVKGDWTVVRKTEDVTDMFSKITAGKRYWLMRDIDMSGKRIAVNTNANFSGEIQGNGYTISNLTVFRGAISGGSISMFGNIKKDTILENLYFTDLKFEYSLKTSANVYFAFSSIEQGAVVHNVTLSGTMTISKPNSADVLNMTSGYENALYGGYTTDADYTGGFSVNGDPSQFITITK